MLDVFIIVFLFFLAFLLVYWHNATFDYICPKCNTKFSITYFQNFFGLNLFRRKYVKCPYCNRRSCCLVVRK